VNSYDISGMKTLKKSSIIKVKKIISRVIYFKTKNL